MARQTPERAAPGRRALVGEYDAPSTATRSGGKRRAIAPVEIAAPAPTRRASARPAPGLGRRLPGIPIVAGVATLAVAALGTVLAAPPVVSVDPSAAPEMRPVSALTGTTDQSTSSLLQGRSQQATRDSERDVTTITVDADLVEAAEEQNTERNAVLAKISQQAASQAAKIALNQWVYPTTAINLTARFGQYGLWASYHTGLDFNGNTGDPIMAIAGGVVTSSGYDGSYGNKTVVTLEDGTEIWYCHQNAMYVSSGEVVRAGQVIGEIGATGHVTGSHLHVEVRPGGGDPVDPYAAMAQHGLF